MAKRKQAYELIEETGLGNINRITKHGNYAYFPGSGPVGTYCEFCQFFKSKGELSKLGDCLKYKEMTGLKRVSAIKKVAPSCKYYVPVDNPFRD